MNSYGMYTNIINEKLKHNKYSSLMPNFSDGGQLSNAGENI